MALAFARLAAMAAATLDFFTCGVATAGATSARSCGSGHALSSCLRDIASSDSNSARPRSRHTPSNTQNVCRAVSLTAGFGSLRLFLNSYAFGEYVYSSHQFALVEQVVAHGREA